MSVYTPPALNAVDFALTAHTPADTTPVTQTLSAYTVPALTAIAFALTAYTPPSFPSIDWDLLPSFPTQYSGLRYYSVTVKELCLVAVADAVGGVRVVKNGTTYSAYLVDTSDPNASGVRVQTGAGVKAIRLKT